MPKDITVYCKNKKLLFQYQPLGEKLFISTNDVNSVFNDKFELNVFNTPFPEKLFSQFSSFFLTIEAAGGIVVNEHNQWLMIYRLGYWDLPKGKIDYNENAIDTAIREIQEECNVSVSKNKALFFDTTYHIYEENQQKILKRTYWYMFFVSNQKHLIPQGLENIEKAEWIDNKKWSKIKFEAYPLISNLLEQTSFVV